MTAMPLALADSIKSISLPAEVRKETGLLAALLKEALAAPHGAKGRAYESAARQMCAAGHSITADGIRALLPHFKREGWHALIDGRKVPHDDNKLPRGFVKEVKRRFDRQPRSRKDAWETLVNEWRAGKTIPGYRGASYVTQDDPKGEKAFPEADPYQPYPSGWSYKHLCRVCRSSAFERVAMTIGLGRAKALHGPKKFTTRAGLHLFSHLAWDDVEHDQIVHLLDRTMRQQCRAVDIGVLDVLSADRFDWGTRPMIKKFDPDQDRMVKQKLKEENVRFLYAKTLHQYGFNPRGTCHVIERGTSTFRDRVMQITRDRMKEIYGEPDGKPIITFDLGGWTGKEQVVAGMFQGKGGGNPRHKPWLESIHNLIHNRLASLPAQTGPDVDRRPEFLNGIQDETGVLLAICPNLTDHQIRQLQFPTLEYYSEFLPLLRHVYDAIARRTDHALEGWADCKFFTRDFRFHRGSQEWLSENQYLALPPADRSMLAQAVKRDGACERPRRLSPREVRLARMHELVKPPESLIAEILYEDLAREQKVKNHYFKIQDQEISPEPVYYDSSIRTLEGNQIELTDGEHFEVVVNPFDLDRLWVYAGGKRGKGAYLGLASRTYTPCRGDEAGNKRALGINESRYAAIRAPLVDRHSNLAVEEAARAQHNADVMAGPRSEIEAQVEEDRALRTADLAAPAQAPDFDAL
jgi:hypothetical protein